MPASDFNQPSVESSVKYTLLWRTRGGKSPQGLPRIFYAAHPADALIYFDRVWEILNKHQDIALYYETAPRTLEKFSEDLGEMQLIVMPVTAKLLREKALDITAILSIAQGKHIPVLPLMFEAGLAPEFRKVFGKLQYLTPGNDDPTAIPFDQKLETFLSGILVGTETAKRVRAAFDAYIFLSYRKKDRAYARRLMRLVHADERLRDVAIWYDEFLTPGENFNDSILKALKSSNLFAMVVTPNLLERVDGKKNYIMEHEYPAAVEESKPIVPCEMAETDKVQLAKEFEGIGTCVSGEEETAIPNVLAERLKTEALRPDTPVHNFLIGLAYLDGIDVEVDYEKALALIQSSAEAGEEEAMRKLVVMYQNGKGVARDGNQTVFWEEKLIECIRKKQAENVYPHSDPVLARELWNLGDMRDEIGKPIEAAEAYIQMHDEAARIHDRVLVIKSQIKVCNLALKIGQPKMAKEVLEEILPLLENDAKNNPSARTFTELAICYERIGMAEEKIGCLSAAKAWYEKTVRIMENLAKTGDVLSRRNLVSAYYDLAEIYHRLRNPDEALKLHKAALTVTETLEKETGTIVSRRDLLLSYIHLGDTMSELKLSADARTWYEKALPFAVSLVNETGTIEDRKNLGFVYQDLGETARSLGNYSEAMKMHKQALAIRFALAKESEVVSSRLELAGTYSHLGNTARGMKNPSEAKEWYKKAAEVCEALVKETDEYRTRRDLSAFYMKIGHAERETGNIQEAVSWYEKALPIEESLWKQTGAQEAQGDLLSCYDYLGTGEIALKNPQNAKTIFEKALLIREENAKKFPSEAAKRDLIYDYERMGNTLWDLNDWRGSAAWYQKALSLLEPAITDTGNLWNRRNAVMCYRKLGAIETALRNPKEAASWYKKNLYSAKKPADETGAAQDRHLLALAMYDSAAGNPVKFLARPVFKQAYSIWKDLADENPNVEEYAKMRDLSAGKIRG